MKRVRNHQIEYQIRLAKDPDYNYKKNKRMSTFVKYKAEAKYRHLDFELTREQFDALIKQPCFYCGGFTPGKTTNGVDRTNSKRGYVKGNVRSCCRMCNVGKLDYSARAFIKHCIKVAQHQGD